MNKSKLMQLAIDLARMGEERTFPNPNVGALIIKDGKIIGQGYHKFFGDHHAEIHALNDAGKNAKNATLVVTLEPCSHYGKTPPCVDAIIEAGIKKVIIGISDPNPLVSGKGIKKLIDAGIQVETGILKSKLEKFYKDYSKRFIKENSYVVLKYAMTLDGKIATVSGDSKWISSEKSRKWVHQFRSQFDGILVGVNTIIKDDPILSSHGMGKNPVRIVLDPELEIPISSNVLNDNIPTVIIYSNDEKKRKIKKIQKQNKFLIKIKTRSGLFEFKDIIKELNKISIFSVLVEGGGLTAWNALKDGVIDEIITFISPKIVGGVQALTPVEGEGIKKIKYAIKTKILEVHKFDEDVFIRSKVIKN